VVVPVCTVTSTLPDACGGTVTSMSVGLMTVTPVAGIPPNSTVAPSAKPEPVRVTFVPPAGTGGGGHGPQCRGDDGSALDETHTPRPVRGGADDGVIAEDAQLQIERFRKWIGDDSFLDAILNSDDPMQKKFLYEI